MKLLIDVNLSPVWVGCLKARGYQADHWGAVGSPTAPDSEIMTFARTQDYVVITHDLDFGAILAATQGLKPSVIQLRADILTPESTGEAVIAAIQSAEDDLKSGALLTLDTNRRRLRILPLLKRESD